MLRADFNKLDPQHCQYCGKECKNLNSLKQHECRCKANPNRKIIDYSSRANRNKGRTAWNKGLTKETDDRIAKMANDLKQKYASGELIRYNPMLDEKYKIKHSEIMKKAYSNYTRRTPGNHKYGYYKGIWCDSSWELAYLLYCEINGFKVIRNKQGFKYIWNDTVHTYFPDFYREDINSFIEIKGYMSERDKAKIEQFIEPLEVIESSKMSLILDAVEAHFGKEFISLYDNKGE